jgi:hypothetical protein
MNFVNRLNPLSIACYLMTSRSVICPKNMRKNGKVIPARIDAPVPMTMYNFSLELEKAKIERNVILC